MKTHHRLLTIAGIGVGLTAGLLLHAPNTGPNNAYPDPHLTPGLVATTDFKELTSIRACGTYSQCHRKTSSATKRVVCKEYPENCTGTQEIDHFCPLALGCADDIRNLWAEPEHVYVGSEDWGFHTKDALENRLVILMKAGLISPSEAQQCILKDWIACYNKYIKNGLFGGVSTTDEDDEVIQ